MTSVKNETGKRYGRLLVIHQRIGGEAGRVYWTCKCDCGKEKSIIGDKLRNGKAVSCGCHALVTEPWRAEARKLREAGMNNGQISRAVGIKLRTIRRFFDMDRGDNPIRMEGRNESWPDDLFIEPHIYRVPKRLDMGPIVAAAMAALADRRAA